MILLKPLLWLTAIGLLVMFANTVPFWSLFVPSFVGGLAGSGFVIWLQIRCSVCAYRFCRCNIYGKDKHNHPYR